MRIYLNNCCYNRPYDDLKQDRIRLEAEAVMSILRLAEIGGWNILGSDVPDVEINKIKNIERCQRVTLLYHIIDEFWNGNSNYTEERAEYLDNQTIEDFEKELAKLKAD